MSETTPKYNSDEEDDVIPAGKPASAAMPMSRDPSSIAVTYDDVAPMLGVVRGNTIYGDGETPKAFADLGYTYAQKDCAGAFLRLVPQGTAGDQAVKSAANALISEGVLQVAQMLDPALAKSCGLFLTKVVGSVFLYRKN